MANDMHRVSSEPNKSCWVVGMQRVVVRHPREGNYATHKQYCCFCTGQEGSVEWIKKFILLYSLYWILALRVLSYTEFQPAAWFSDTWMKVNPTAIKASNLEFWLPLKQWFISWNKQRKDLQGTWVQKNLLWQFWSLSPCVEIQSAFKSNILF